MNPGDLLCNRYQIEQALAAGGFGETYLAIDLHLPSKPRVVVKHLKPLNNDPATLQIAQRMFAAEAKVLEELGKNSDRIPTLYTYFEDKIKKQINRMVEERSEFYLVQEFIAGQTLTAELKSAGGKLSEAQVIEILQEILAGLQEVHQKDKIHRDLKPDNIIRRAEDGKLVLIDFGAVKEIRQISSTANNAIASATVPIGSKGYMPTEQAIGFPRLASDVYAVGAIGIQCLTGKHPSKLFNEAALALLWQHHCQVSSGLAAILEKMVAQNANDRYFDGAEAAEAVQHFLNPPQPQPTPISAQPINSPPPVIPVAGVPVQQSIRPPQPLALVPQSPPQAVSPPVASVPPAAPVQPVAQAAKPQAAASPVPQPSPAAATPPAQKKQNPPAAKPAPSASRNGKTSANNHGRRNFLMWLGLGGVSAMGVVALNQFGKSSPTSETGSLPVASALSKFGSAPQLTKIQFTSVKLDSYGKIVDRPSGQAEIFTEDLGGGVLLTMAKIPAGKFMMGSPTNEEKRHDSESPQHQVTLPEFYLGQTLVTQGQWQVVMGNNPSHFKGDDKLPVETVSWLEAMNFCQKLSKKTGRIYRLPSEAEWEYACRAGTTIPFAFGETISTDVANYNGNYTYAKATKGEYRKATTVASSFPANLFGLYDMHGNLWEWCLDEWINNYENFSLDGSPRMFAKDSGRTYVLRGGSWVNNPSYCRSAARLSSSPAYRNNFVGFRVVSRARTL